MNIIWDFDGTLFNTYPRILNAFNVVLNSHYNLQIPREDIEEMVFVDTKYCAKAVAKENNLEYEVLLKEIRSFYNENGDSETIFSEVLPILEDNRFTHFLVTHRDQRSLNEKLKEAHIYNCFQEIISKDEGFEDKPNPTSFEYLIQKYNLNREETVAIGDRDIDVGAGKNAQIPTILISKRSHPDAEITIPDHKDLYKSIKSLNKEMME